MPASTPNTALSTAFPELPRARGEIAAAAVSAASIGYFNLRHPEARITLVHAEDEEPELRWAVAVGMRRADDDLVRAVNGALAGLLENDTLTAICARYGVAYRRP